MAKRTATIIIEPHLLVREALESLIKNYRYRVVCSVGSTADIDDSATAGDGPKLVILGAGFDSRGFRLPGMRDLTVFEVDHPATQTTKRKTLACVLSVLPQHVRFVAIDFNQCDLESVMATAGYRASARTVFLWEGVTHYLTEATVDTTLRWCSCAAPGSLLLFTYVHRDVLTRPSAFIGTQRLFATLAKVGEQLTFGIDPSQLPAFLAKHGLSLESDVGTAEYRERYFKDAARKMRGHEFYRVALARVGSHIT